MFSGPIFQQIDESMSTDYHVFNLFLFWSGANLRILPVVSEPDPTLQGLFLSYGKGSVGQRGKRCLISGEWINGLYVDTHIYIYIFILHYIYLFMYYTLYIYNMLPCLKYISLNHSEESFGNSQVPILSTEMVEQRKHPGVKLQFVNPIRHGIPTVRYG